MSHFPFGKTRYTFIGQEEKLWDMVRKVHTIVVIKHGVFAIINTLSPAHKKNYKLHHKTKVIV